MCFLLFSNFYNINFPYQFLSDFSFFLFLKKKTKTNEQVNTLCWQILKCFLNNLINRSKLFSSPNSKPKCLTQTSDVGPGRAKKSVMDVCLCLSNSIENITLTQKFVTGQILKFWIHFCFLYERSNEKITSEINFFFR